MAKKRTVNKSLASGKPSYTYDDKLAILRYWEDNNMDAEMTMARFNVGRSTLFIWKKKYWEDMLDMKDAKLINSEQAEKEKETSVLMPVVKQKRINELHRKASTVTEQLLELVLLKLEREIDYMTDNPEQMGKIKIQEISKLLEVAASFVLPKATQTEQEGAFSTMEQKYSRITQYIQNNFLQNGSKKNTTNGNGRLVTITPGSKGEGDGDNEPEIQE